MRARLESEGIHCFVRNEFTTQVDNFISNAIDGILLQVASEDYEKAKSLLIEWEEWTEQSVDAPSAFWLKFDRLTSKIPIIKGMEVLLRFIVLFGISFSLIALLFYYLFAKSDFERISNNSWCVEYITYDETIYSPSTIFTMNGGPIALYISPIGCDEAIHFNESSISLPGFQTNRISGSWFIDNDKIVILNPDTLGHIFEGAYSIELSTNTLIMHAPRTSIYCKRLTYDF